MFVKLKDKDNVCALPKLSFSHCKGHVLNKNRTLVQRRMEAYAMLHVLAEKEQIMSTQYKGEPEGSTQESRYAWIQLRCSYTASS